REGSRSATISRLVAVFTATISSGVRFFAISDRLHSTEPWLHAEVQLLPLHHPGKRHAIALTGKRGVGNAQRHETARLSLLQIPRSALRSRPPKGAAAGRSHRP